MSTYDREYNPKYDGPEPAHIANSVFAQCAQAATQESLELKRMAKIIRSQRHELRRMKKAHEQLWARIRITLIEPSSPKEPTK